MALRNFALVWSGQVAIGRHFPTLDTKYFKAGFFSPEKLYGSMAIDVDVFWLNFMGLFSRLTGRLLPFADQY